MSVPQKWDLWDLWDMGRMERMGRTKIGSLSLD